LLPAELPPEEIPIRKWLEINQSKSLVKRYWSMPPIASVICEPELFIFADGAERWGNGCRSNAKNHEQLISRRLAQNWLQ
jgi:hypothetical protein